MRAASLQQLGKSCRISFKFYCMFYFTCDRSFSCLLVEVSLYRVVQKSKPLTFKTLSHFIRCPTARILILAHLALNVCIPVISKDPTTSQTVCYTTLWLLMFPQDSVDARLKCGGVFTDRSLANSLPSAPVKELYKSVSIWWNYDKTWLTFLDTVDERDV